MAQGDYLPEVARSLAACQCPQCGRFARRNDKGQIWCKRCDGYTTPMTAEEFMRPIRADPDVGD